MFSAQEVEKHNNRQSCWVIIEDEVYDVTDFIDEHPGGPGIILRYAGKDATEEYNPVHPPGTIEKELAKEKHLGKIDPSTKSTVTAQAKVAVQSLSQRRFPIEFCMNINDFERAAKAVANKRTWTYYSSAADDLHSHRRNLEDWSRVIFRPRVLRNVQKVNMRCTILGHASSLPIFIAPAALGRLGHPDGELCLTRGAGRHNIPYAVSTASSVSVEELCEDMKREGAQGCMFYQLYVKKRQSETRAAIQKARSLGFKGLMITVDTPVVGKREEDERYKAELAFEAGVIMENPVTAVSPGEVTVLRGPFSSTLNWDDLRWMREEWGDAGPICLKGIATAEDARLACELGVKSIYLSNHGGRQLDSAPSSLRTLLEIRKFCPEVFDQCEVLIDGGIRRGSDVLKALCLGARAVGVGRPCMYALTAYGEEGVFKAIQILSDELETSMRLLGVTDVEALKPHMINTRELEALIMTDIPDMSPSRPRL